MTTPASPYDAPLPDWTPDERPSMPGSASTPNHSIPVRIAYGLIGALLGITGGLGNALVSANLASIQGHLGLDPVQGGWLPAVYLMVNMSANMLLVKFRQQYGLIRFAEIGLPIYAAVTVLHLFVEDYPMALLVRAASGLAGAVVSTLAVLYMLQAFPKKSMATGLIIGLGISQLATPLAWLLSPSLLDLGEWRTLYLFEAGLALCTLAAVVILKLPPGIRERVFEPLDLVTFLLIAPGLALLGGVLAQGRTQWWLTQSWIAYALIAAIVLLTAGFLIELHRQRPLFQIGWLTSAATIRFAIGALTLRFLLSEQNYGAVGLLQTLGMGPDQLRPLYGLMLVALIAGIATSALTFGPRTQVPQILVAIVLIGVGSFIDMHSTSLTRPQDMVLSQGLLSFASGIFMGPLMLIGITSALANGPSYLVSFSVLFGMTQSMGGLAGPAALGTFQILREKFHSSAITEQLDPTNPIVAGRLQAQGAAGLGQIATREANVLAYDDVFLLTGLLSMVFLGWSLAHTVRLALRDRAEATAASGTRAAT